MEEKPFRYKKTLFRLGGSLVISVPKIWLRTNKLYRPTEVWLEIYHDRIVIRPVKETSVKEEIKEVELE